MQLVITVRQNVRDSDEGTEAYEWVKQHLIDKPELKVTGHLTNHFPEEPEEPFSS